jgi:hypothetical protein
MAEYIAQHFKAKFPDRLRLPFAFDPALLARDLAYLSSVAWVRHYVRQNYEGDWSVIALRAPAGETHPIRMINADPTCENFVDTPLLEACPYFREVLGTFQAPLRNVRLMRLAAGSVIKEHEDLDLSFEDGKVRLHIPVVTNEDVDFRLNHQRVVLEAASCWYLRLSDPHSVANRGTGERVHLVVDAVVNDWVGRIFEEAASAAASRPTAPSPMMSLTGGC